MSKKKTISSLIYKSIEIELLVKCSTTKINPKSIERIKKITEKTINWDYFITMAKVHKVAPLVFVNLIHIASELIPANELYRLKKIVRSIVKKNLYIIKELVILINCFESNNIPAIPYKGVTLAATLYQDPSLRLFTDLDFLVPSEKYVEAQKLLMTLGYKPPLQNNVDWEKSFVNSKKKASIDLHQGLAPAYFYLHINFQALWKRLESVFVGGVEIKSFSSEDMLIILCVQLAKDSQWTAEVLIKVCDIAELIRVNQALNWDTIWQRCKKLGTKRILLFSLYVSKEMLEAEIPDFIWQKIKADKVAQKAALQVCEEFFDRSEESFANRTFTERVYLRKLLRERLKDKVAYFLKTAITPNEKDLEMLALPRSLGFAYYLLRPIRLAAKLFRDS